MKVLLPGNAFEVKGNGVADLSEHVITRRSCGHTAGQIGHIGREIVIGFFDHNGKSLGHVPGVRSSLGLPATVTRPGRSGCLNCLWLPRVATSTQAACSKAELAMGCIRGITENSPGGQAMKILLTGAAGQLG